MHLQISDTEEKHKLLEQENTKIKHAVYICINIVHVFENKFAFNDNFHTSNNKIMKKLIFNS